MHNIDLISLLNDGKQIVPKTDISPSFLTEIFLTKRNIRHYFNAQRARK